MDECVMNEDTSCLDSLLESIPKGAEVSVVSVMESCREGQLDIVTRYWIDHCKRT